MAERYSAGLSLSPQGGVDNYIYIYVYSTTFIGSYLILLVRIEFKIGFSSEKQKYSTGTSIFKANISCTVFFHYIRSLFKKNGFYQRLKHCFHEMLNKIPIKLIATFCFLKQEDLLTHNTVNERNGIKHTLRAALAHCNDLI